MKKLLLIPILALSSFYGICQNYSDSLNIRLEGFHKEKALSGFAAAIVNMDGILYKNSLGYADIENKKPYTQKTVQCIASTSKTTIAFAIMKLEEEGKLSLDSPINSFLPFNVSNPNFPDSILRIKHLVTHTSGIVDTDNNYNLRGRYFLKSTNLKNSKLPKENIEWFESIQKNKKTSLKKYCKNVFSEKGKWCNKNTFNSQDFGSHYEYSNIGAILMAYIVERASGKCYKKYIRKNIFDVLKMTETTFDEKKVNPKYLAKSYVMEDLIATPALGDNTYPDGGIHTNSEELSLYLIEMIRGYNGKSELLTKASYKKMMSPLLSKEVAATNNESKNFDNIGVFWQMRKDGSIMHNGGNPFGGTVYFSFNPKTNIGRILMTNCDVMASRDTIVEFISIWRTLEKYVDKL